MLNFKLILGSKSPRRKELLKDSGFNFEIRTKETDESYPDNLDYSDVPTFIASKKAEALLDTLTNHEVLLCSDTVVVIDKEILGKPKDKNDAIEMLTKLSGKSHEVLTGVVIQSKTKKVTLNVCTKVTFKVLSDFEINHYIDHYKPFDKAGAYGIQEWIGYIGVKEIKGSYFNVVGLPTQEVYEALLKF